MGKGHGALTAQNGQWICYSVALQLALDTFISVYRQVLTLQSVITRTFGLPLAALAFTKTHQRIVSNLYTDLESLVKPPQNILAQHYAGDGPLGQLVHDCNRLMARESGAIVLRLSRLADKAWIEAHQALQCFVHERNQAAVSSHSPKCLPFLAQVSKIVRTMDRFAKTWPNLLKEHRYDENILYFLLRRRQDFDTLCEKGFIRNLFISLFPKGSGQLRTLIIEAYAKRGFEHLIPTLNSNIEELGSW